MVTSSVEIKGLDSINRKLGSLGPLIIKHVQQGLLKSGFLVQILAQKKAPVGKTGLLRANIFVKPHGTLEVTVTADMDYAVHVEFGTFKMKARPFMRNAIREAKKKIIKIIKQSIQDAIREAIR